MGVKKKKRASSKKTVSACPKNCAENRYQVFVREYLLDFNATRAAKAAGYSEKTADQQGSRLLRNIKVQALLKRAIDRRNKRFDLKDDRVLEEIARLSFSKMSDVAEWDNHGVRIKPSSELPEEALAAISEISQHDTKEGRQIKVKFHDKNRSLDMAARHLGLLKDTLNLKLIEPIVIKREDGSEVVLKQVAKE